MAKTRRLMRGVTAKQVFAVLNDGFSYGDWVVGTRSIRDVDEGWPSVGTRLHYRVGYGPLTKDDVTSSKVYADGERLELEAHAWPAGTAHITLTTEPGEGGTLVSIDEFPLRGPARLLRNPLTDVLIATRNVLTLRRLEQQVRDRS